MRKYLMLGIVLGIGFAALPTPALIQETDGVTTVVSDIEIDGDLYVEGNVTIDGEGVGDWTSDYYGDTVGNLKGGPWKIMCPNGDDGDPQGVVVGLEFRRYRKDDGDKDRYQIRLICR